MKVKKLGILLCLPLILSLSGCFVQALYPTYTAEATVEMPELVGAWREADDPEQKNPAWQFKDDGTIITYEDEVASAVEAVYFRVGDHLFVDWTAGELDEESKINLYWSIHVMPTHSVLRVDHHDDALALVPLDLDWITEAVSADPSLLPYVHTEQEDRLLFVAFPEEWEAFLLEHATNTAAFKPDSALSFIRAPAEEAAAAQPPETPEREQPSAQ